MKILRKVPKDTLVVHGTSIEAIEELFAWNEMPYPSSGFLYLEPVGDNFTKSKFVTLKIPPIENSDEIFNLKQLYAIQNAQKHNLEKYLGYIPDWIENGAVLDKEKDWYAWLLEEECLNSNKAKKIAKQVYSRKGVLIIPTIEFISNNKVEYAPPNDGVRFKLAKPVCRKDIESIIPQGDIENRILEKLFQYKFQN